jgi:ATP-dependent helicase/nuclease subunit A
MVMEYREAVSLSAAQRKVLFDEASRTLVAAGAGSGKTRMLVAYFVHALLDLGVEMKDLAAVTFTRKAGSELAERIRKELIDCGRPDLARSIDSAAIGTIHGLCRRLLATEALKAGVDPSFGVLEPDAQNLVRLELFAKAWGRAVEEASEEELRILASRGDSLRTLVLSLYDRLRGTGLSAPRVSITGGVSGAGAREELLGLCDEALRQGYQTPRMGPDLQKSLDKVAVCRQWLEAAAKAPEGELKVADTSDFFPSMRTGSAKPYLEPVRDALIRYRQTLAEQELKRLVDAVNKLLATFHEEYEAFKESRGMLDFSDLEVRAGAMLGGDGGGFETGGSVLATHLLVDEFQDTNEVQCAIIDGLRPDRLLMVGDARQSIYSFRGADVEVFLARERDAEIAQFPLDTNYRSRAEVLAFVNHLFSRESFFADRFKPLLAGRGPGPGPDPADSHGESGPTEILVVERTAAVGEEEELAKRQAEAYVVAERVRRLVFEQGWSQADVVVLLPQLTEVNQYQDALIAQGLRVYVVRGKGYYSQDEVADISALLRLLLNPHDDLALLTVLRSPLVGVSDDCLYVLGRASRARHSRSLWEAVREGSAVDDLDHEDRERLQALVARLDGLRERIGRPGLSRLIDDALAACDYDLCLLAAPHGTRRFANARKLMRMAADYEDLEGPDLRGFATLIGSLGDMGDDEGNAPSLAEGEDVVRVMTVHQAKGLEFPVVVLAGLCSDPPGYKAGEIMVGSDGRMAARIMVPSNSPDRPGWGPVDAIIEEQKRRKADEDIRVLYVAMTRARDQLILVGSRSFDDKPEALRIGRIVTALGLAAPPAPGVSVPFDGIHAIVMGVAPVSVADAGGAAPGPAGSEAGVAGPPALLDLPARAVAVRQVSFSALAAYGRCPRRFYLERVLGLGPFLPARGSGQSGDPDESDPEKASVDEGRLDDTEGSTGIEIGIVVHALLERLDLGAGRPDKEGLRVQAKTVAVEKGLSVTAEALEHSVALAGAFWVHPLAGTPEAARAKHEAPFFFVQNGVAVSGVMDLLIQERDRWLVIDYKSNALGGRSPGEAAEGYSLQAVMYCLAALKAGAPAIRMEFLFLERPGEPVAFEYSAKDLAALEALLEKALAGIKAGDFGARTGPNCADCDTKNVCEAMSRR